MKKTLVLATALALAGCASTDKSASSGNFAMSSGSAMYCWEDKLSTQGDNLVCNWEPTTAAACDASYLTPLSKATVAKGPDKIRMCTNGKWLVQVTLR